MSCSQPCLTCSGSSFSACTSCDTSMDPDYELQDGFCVIEPIWYIQLACTCFLAVFICLPLFRKRSMVLMRVFDCIQFAAYFKYVVGYVSYRHNYLYLGMNGMTPWSEGLQLVKWEKDQSVPIFTIDQTSSNRLIRIGGLWLLLPLLVILAGVFKSCCAGSGFKTSVFLSRNIGNALAICFYVTVQDIAFYLTLNFLGLIDGSASLDDYMDVVFLVIAVVGALVVLILIVWQFVVINTDLDANQREHKYYQYQMMFLFRMDYDLFQTYSLTHLPSKQKVTHRYSNLLLIDIFKKIGYAALIASGLTSPTTQTVPEQFYSILGYVLFFMLVWYVTFPFDHRKEIIQILICILADLLLLTLIVFPIVVNRPQIDTLYMVLCLSLFGLALLSAIFQLCLNVYSFLPYDLYGLGISVIVEDKELRRELEERKRQQLANQKRIKQLEEEQERLKAEMENGKQKTQMASSHPKSTAKGTARQAQQRDSQGQLGKGKHGQHSQESLSNNHEQEEYPAEVLSNHSQDLEQYRIDIKKRRKVYEFDKRKNFVYSNKMDE